MVDATQFQAHLLLSPTTLFIDFMEVTNMTYVIFHKITLCNMYVTKLVRYNL